MQDGAFVLVDCLGFRGIWNKVDPEQLVNKLKKLETTAREQVVPQYSATNLSFGPVKFHLRLLSDTVALSVQYEANPLKVPSEWQKSLLVSMACDAASVLAGLFMGEDDMPFPLRGCISFGKHLCDGNFLIGPAVDEAAEYMNEPDGAFIWLLPSAARKHEEFLTRSSEILNGNADSLVKSLKLISDRGIDEATKLLERMQTPHHVEVLRLTSLQILAIPNVIASYPMPIKRGMVIDAAVVNPLLEGKTSEERQRMIERYERFLEGDRIDIWVKRQNTLKFLAVANEAAARFFSTLGSDGNSPTS